MRIYGPPCATPLQQDAAQFAQYVILRYQAQDGKNGLACKCCCCSGICTLKAT